MKRRLLIFGLFGGLFSLQNFAQEKPPVRFGKINAGDFNQTKYSIDSAANAVIIADVGSTEMVDNGKGGFALQFKNYRRARILTKNGYDIANVTIPLYTDGRDEEKLNSLRAVTYNWENGKIIETRLETKSAVFKDRIDNNWTLRKFTFPNIKEGSIIEYEYEVRSDFKFNLQPWKFQDDQYPELWSEYNVALPEFYYYVTLSQGYQPFYIRDQKNRTSSFTISDNSTAGTADRHSFTAGITDYRWVMKNVPALKEESFTSTLKNHIAKIEFQLAESRSPLVPQNFMSSWPETSDQLLKAQNFGYSLSRDNPWLTDELNKAIKGAPDDLQKAKRIFAYVRDNMMCTDHDATEIKQPLKNALKNRSGNVAEINLLLVTMLLKAGLGADPVLLSTRSHGYTLESYPLLDRFNYVVAQTVIDGNTYYLDASEPGLGFGHLPYQCYNGHARVINAEATPVDFTPDSLLEKKVTTFFVVSNEKGNLSGNVQQVPGYYESYRLRSAVKEKGTPELVNEIKKGFSGETEIKDLFIDSLNNYEGPVTIRYDFDSKMTGDEIVYINPMFGEGYKENPFKSVERFYPVEMPYTIDETFQLQMQLPAGYEVDELPQQLVVKLNEHDDGLFEYRITESNGTISLRSRLRIKRSLFEPDEYSKLREFFSIVVKKHSEQIVLKKKK
jgi:hypothetical protein